jgi:2-dehydro-3-deoxyphosphogluconate aldolase/(4S)-4-hydroxy-2-oxoglutarate aldolase
MKAARDADNPLIPGVATKSEIIQGLEHCYTHLKFLPAEQQGGVGARKAQAGPRPSARICPPGSITAEKAPAYLALESVLCVGGSWIATADKIKAQDWSGIEAAAKRAAALRG